MSTLFDFSRLDQPFEADWPVLIRVPQDGGSFEEQTFTARFRQLTTDEIEAATKSETFSYRTPPQLYFVGFGKGEGQPPWSSELRDRLVATVHVREALNRAFTGFNTGVAQGN